MLFNRRCIQADRITKALVDMTTAPDQPHLVNVADLPARARSPGLFRSYWIAGYEGADHINGTGVPLSLNQLTGHWDHLDEDYARLAPFGIKTVRESLGWRLTESDNTYDWSRLEQHARMAAEHGIEVIWTLQHYGWPSDVDPFAPHFADRFARYCEQVARRLKPFSDTPPFFQPINEISFLTWAVCSTSLIYPFDGSLEALGFEFKKQLVKAALRGSEAIWSVDPRARIIHTDPVVHIVPPRNASPELIEETLRRRESQFQAWDMLCGRIEPQLGGSRKHLDILGLNYYHANQWEHQTDAILFWHLNNPRRVRFSELAANIWKRYERPMFIAETSHVGEGRCAWLDDIAREVLACEQRGVPIEGICLYPILDRPDWENLNHWHHSGLWDIDTGDTPSNLDRILHQPYAERLLHWQLALHPPQRLRATPSLQQIDSKGTIMPPTILVFSHLRWNFVYQRPQHLLSRLAGHYRIIFMEEPVNNAAESFIERFTPCAYVEVLRPHVPGNAYGFDDANMPALKALLGQYLSAHDITDFMAWFYTPMALPLLENLAPRNIIYDCMDELSAFKNAPAQLIDREKTLFGLADIVFTGGPSLHQSKKPLHSNIHCFMSSVDAAHFAPPTGEASANYDAADQSDLPHPRLGYCGVIDERIDLNLIAALADAHHEWQIVMVGPVVKIDPTSLPQRANIHWMGQRTYEELPRFMAGWDLCLLPFALNESTRYISPTKTLEYMAAQRPMVSTNIKDVAEPYRHAVPIALDHTEFIAACERLLGETGQEKSARQEAMRQIVAKTSWDKTALAMHNLIAKLQPETKSDAAGVVPLPVAIHNSPSYSVPVAPAASSIPHFGTVILGAGPTGLSAAYHLGKDSLLLEAQPTVGGWCRSIEDNGFTFDFAGHIMFSNDDYVLEMYKKLLGDNIHWQNREAWIYSKDVYTRYPFQGALYGLPPDVLKECVMGAIEARFGPLKKEDRRAAASSMEKGGVVSEAKPPKNFEEFIYKVWGAGVAKHFAIPYNKKLWAVPLDEMETSWLGSRVPMPDLEEMIEGALKPVPKPMGPNARFGYPLKGGFQALMNGFLPLLEGELQLNARVVGVSPSKRIVTLQDGRRYRYDNLISTLPLPKLVQAMGDEAPEDLKQAAAGLRHVSVRCVNLGIGRPNISEKHWVYYPEYPIFHRIFLQGNASPHCNPPGGFGLTCEITYSEYKPLPYSGQDLIERCIDDCVRVGMINADDPIWAANEIDIPYAYVVYDHDRIQNVATIRDWMAGNNIVLAGRYSEWEYYNSDHAFIAGKKAAEQVSGAMEGKMAANI